MNVIVTVEHRFDRTPDGAIWTQAAFSYTFWKRYLDVFDTVQPCARVRNVAEPSNGWVRVDGPGVSFSCLPYYVGPFQFALKTLAIRRALAEVFKMPSAIIMRVPSQLARLTVSLLRGRPYALEVVGDPYDVFSPGAVKHPLRPFFRYWFTKGLQLQCAKAAAAAYVTRETLQRRYPPGAFTFSTYFSSVELTDEAFARGPKNPSRKAPFRLIFVGSLAQQYKGADTLLEATALCIRNGMDIFLVMVGDGRHRQDLERLAAKLGMSERVLFTGQLTAGDDVRAHLDRADLFVLPSLTEGLPRALIEAMARGLPCVASAVGGIPELLDPEDMVPPNEPEKLAGLIATVLRNPARRAYMAARNYARARDYHIEALRKRWIIFYRRIEEIIRAWQREKCN